MPTLQKALSEIRVLLDEELDMVGGLAGSSVQTETFKWTNQSDGHGGQYATVDEVTMKTESD